jgi:O-acetylhomoserine/O-acetylserine sulfhydrylase-like pyridoxal-dependent enzyme
MDFIAAGFFGRDAGSVHRSNNVKNIVRTYLAGAALLVMSPTKPSLVGDTATCNGSLLDCVPASWRAEHRFRSLLEPPEPLRRQAAAVIKTLAAFALYAALTFAFASLTA